MLLLIVEQLRGAGVQGAKDGIFCLVGPGQVQGKGGLGVLDAPGASKGVQPFVNKVVASSGYPVLRAAVELVEEVFEGGDGARRTWFVVNGIMSRASGSEGASFGTFPGFWGQEPFAVQVFPWRRGCSCWWLQVAQQQRDVEVGNGTFRSKTAWGVSRSSCSLTNDVGRAGGYTHRRPLEVQRWHPGTSFPHFRFAFAQFSHALISGIVFIFITVKDDSSI